VWHSRESAPKISHTRGRDFRHTTVPMRRVLPLGVCLIAALALASAAAAERVVIRVTSLVTIENQQLVRTRVHPTAGDLIEFKDLLLARGGSEFGKPEGRAVAWDQGIVRYTSATTEVIHVRVYFPFVGTFDYEGQLNTGPNGTSVIPIVASTGAFKGAKGTVTIGQGSESAPNTFTLTVPGDSISVSSSAEAA